jgi:hypothetical protein
MAKIIAQTGGEREENSIRGLMDESAFEFGRFSVASRFRFAEEHQRDQGD